MLMRRLPSLWYSGNLSFIKVLLLVLRQILGMLKKGRASHCIVWPHLLAVLNEAAWIKIKAYL